MQVCLPENLCRETWELGRPASEPLPEVVRVEVRRRKILAATDEHLPELAAEVSEATPEDKVWAKARVDRIAQHAPAFKP